MKNFIQSWRTRCILQDIQLAFHAAMNMSDWRLNMAEVIWGNQADKPVYEEDGSGAHVSWCPCYPCFVERTYYVCWNCGKDARRDKPHACDTLVIAPEVAVGPGQGRRGDGEAAMGDPSTRNLVFRFWNLKSSERREIAVRLGLITEEELKLPEAERYGRALIRASERGQLDELALAVAQKETM